MCEDIFDRFYYENNLKPEFKTAEGWYNPEVGEFRTERIDELKRIQKALKDIGIDCTLSEAEGFWISYCQEGCANWFEFDDEPLNEYLTEFAKKHFDKISH